MHLHDKVNKKDFPEGTPKKPNLIRWALLVASVAVVAVISLHTLQTSANEPDTLPEADLRTIGDANAPVTITEYADYACITCKAWHQFGVRDQIFEAYEGQVRFVWHDFPVTSPNSSKAAEAGFCAHEQGQFWAYHDILFDKAPALGVENLVRYAEEIGLQTTQFETCLETGKYQAAVKNELNNAGRLGLRSVPSFLVNEQRLFGPPSFAQLAAIIDEILLANP